MNTADSTAAERAALRAELDTLRTGWREALLAAGDALQAESGVLPPEELVVHQRHLQAEYEAVAAELRRFALDEGIPAELAEPFLPRGRARRALGLPKAIQACVFELDDVLVSTGRLHGEAWSRAFDELLSCRAEKAFDRAIPPEPFDPCRDYRSHIEGRAQLDGVRAFLASRGIRLPEGGPDDPPGYETVNGIANRQSECLGALLEHEGVRPVDGARHYLEIARDAGVSCAVVAASAHTHEILERSGLAKLVAVDADADAVASGTLRSRPARDGLEAACRTLHVEPERAAAFETSPVGIEAARDAKFRLVVGVDLHGDPARLGELRRAGAGLAVTCLAELIERAG